MEGLIALGSTFESFGLDRRIRKAVEKKGFAHPTLIQEKTIPLALQGKDILARAKTGSGKTLAYVIPIIQKILLSKEVPNPKAGTRCVALLPTRELCAQVAEVFLEMVTHCKKVVNVVDLGVDVDDNTQGAMLRDKPDVVVTTPARLLKFLKKNMLDLKVCFESLVVDEADLILSLGYEADLKEIVTFLPKIYQGYLMSATLDDATQTMRKLLLHTPVVLHLKDSPAAASNLDEAVMKCSDEDKFLVTYSLLRLNLIPPKVLIFVNSIERCLQLKLFLDRFSVQSIVLNSELPSEARMSILHQFNSGDFNFLIATDELFEDLGVDIKVPPVDMKQEPASTVEEVKEDEESSSDKQVVDVPDDEDGSDEDSEAENEEKDEDEVDEEEEEDGESDEEDADTSIVKEELDDEEVTTTKKSKKVKAIKEEDVKMEGDGDSKKDKKKKKKNRRSKSGKDTEYGVSRGLDFKDVKTVINFDFPTSTKSYVHRIGRTARGTAKGLALSLVSYEEEERLLKVESKRSLQIKDFGLQLKAIEQFRYRCEDVLLSIKASHVKKARAAVVRREIIASTKLKQHFKENPREKEILKAVHSKAALPNTLNQGQGLRSIPNYLVSQQIAGNVNNPVPVTANKKRKYAPKGKRNDPVLYGASKKKKNKAQF